MIVLPLFQELEPSSKLVLDKLVPRLNDPHLHHAWDVLLPLCMVLERETRVALMVSTSWTDLKSFFDAHKNLNTKELRKRYTSFRNLGDQGLRNFRFFSNLHTPKKFHPSLSDIALIISTFSIHTFEQTSELEILAGQLLEIQRVRNTCTHGPVDDRDELDLSRFLGKWTHCLHKVLEWKLRATTWLPRAA